MPALSDAEAARDSVQKVIDDLSAGSADIPTADNPVTSVTVTYADGSTVNFGVAIDGEAAAAEQSAPPSGAPDTGTQVEEGPHEPSGTVPEGA